MFHVARKRGKKKKVVSSSGFSVGTAKAHRRQLKSFSKKCFLPPPLLFVFKCKSIQITAEQWGSDAINIIEVPCALQEKKKRKRGKHPFSLGDVSLAV